MQSHVRGALILRKDFLKASFGIVFPFGLGWVSAKQIPGTVKGLKFKTAPVPLF